MARTGDPQQNPPARRPARHHKAGEFTRGYPYEGWNKSVYEINTFDAYSTEFRLAAIFESSNEVSAWVRINETVPLRIPYLIGAVQKQYEPDFIVIDNQRHLLDHRRQVRQRDDLARRHLQTRRRPRMGQHRQLQRLRPRQVGIPPRLRIRHRRLVVMEPHSETGAQVYQ